MILGAFDALCASMVYTLTTLCRGLIRRTELHNLLHSRENHLGLLKRRTVVQHTHAWQRDLQSLTELHGVASVELQLEDLKLLALQECACVPQG